MALASEAVDQDTFGESLRRARLCRPFLPAAEATFRLGRRTALAARRARARERASRSGGVARPGLRRGAAASAGGDRPCQRQLEVAVRRARFGDALLAGLPGTSFVDPATGEAIALSINTALSQALAANAFTEPDGSPVTDPAFVAALAAATVRYSHQTRQFAISSDPGSAATEGRSSVELLPTANDLAAALGFAPPALVSPGKQRLHRLPPPRSMTVEVRLDLWSRTQGDIAYLFDGLAYAAPTRGRLTLRPSLLAEDAADGSTELRLLDRGEPTTLESLAHLEGGDGLRDRARGVLYTASAGASHQASSFSFSLTGSGQIQGPVWSAPLVPDPLWSSQPAPSGFAVALGLRLEAGAVAGERYTVLRLTRAGVTVLEISAEIETVNVPPDGDTQFATITANATVTQPGGPAQATTVRRVPLESFVAGGTLHVNLSGELGELGLYWNGEPQRFDDAVVSPSAPVAAPGVVTTGENMTLVLGGGAADPFPRGLELSHVHLQREPYGPLDPRLRASLAGARRLRPGDMIAVASSDDGWRLGDRRSAALVAAVQGDKVTLTRPLSGSFGRGRALVYQDECFFFQTAVKRRDDLMNQLYHCSVDYKVSALLEDPVALSTSVLVRETHEELSARGASRAHGAAPGTYVVDADPASGAN